MRSTSRVPVHGTTEIDRTEVHEDEQLFGSVLKDIAKQLWPDDTAAFIASEIGCSPRAVEFYFAGDRKWSGDAVALIVSEILRRHRMRNVRVAARR